MLRKIYPVPGDPVDLAREYAYPALASVGTCVRAVFISSLDGAATVNGRSGALGSASDKTIFALLRGLADVVLAGSGTAAAEKYGPIQQQPPWGDVRQGRTPTPPLAIISGTLNFDADSPLFTRAPDYARTILITCESAPAKKVEELSARADIIVAGDQEVDLAKAVQALAERGHQRISCEGGPHLFAQLSKARLLDELCLTLSPLLVAGDELRITNGASIPGGLGMQLSGVLEDDSYLFLRYHRRV